MQSKNPLFQPPIEADSLFLKVTQGCSYNRCFFCGTYREVVFKQRTYEELEREVEKVCTRHQEDVRRIFLGDGDALVAETRYLRKVLRLFKEAFPNLLNVGIYATPQALLNKTNKELAALRKDGLESVYMGIESGSDKVLGYVNKGVSAEEIRIAACKATDQAFKLSALVVLGAGGRRGWREHASMTGRLLSEINPAAIIMLTLVLVPNTPLFDAVRRGEFTTPTPVESVLELKRFIESLNLDGTIFRSNHSSNYLKVGGTLPADKENMLHQLERVLNNPTEEFFNPEYFRG